MQGMTYMEALVVLNEPEGRIARRAWSGQGYVYARRFGDATSRIYVGADGDRRRWGGCFDPKYNEGVNDWLDVTGAVDWKTALANLRSGAWKAALRLSWGEPCFIKPSTIRVHEIGDEDMAAINNSYIPAVAREFLCISVIGSRTTHFEHNKQTITAMDWVEATPVNMCQLMPSKLPWAQTLNFLNTGKFGVRQQGWPLWRVMRMDKGGRCMIHEAGRVVPASFMPDAAPWDILPPDWFIEQYGEQKASAQEITVKPVYEMGCTTPSEEFSTPAPVHKSLQHDQRCSGTRAKEYLNEGRKVRPAMWAKTAPNAYLFVRDNTIMLQPENDLPSLWNGEFDGDDWQLLPHGWKPPAYAEAEDPDGMSMSEAFAFAQKLMDAGRQNVELHRAAWPAGRAVIYKEVTTILGDKATMPFVQDGGADMCHWVPTYDDHVFPDWYVYSTPAPDQPQFPLDPLLCPLVEVDDGPVEKKDPSPDFSFSEALFRLKERRRVARHGWGKPYYIQLHKSTDYGDCFIMGRPASSLTPMYTPTTEDLLVDDWYEVEA